MGIAHLGVVEFTDATNQRAGKQVTDAFRRELSAAFGPERVMASEPAVPVGQAKATGLIGISQAQQIGRLNNLEGLLTGQVLSYNWQPRSGRVWVSISLRLLETTRGSIIWSRNATGTFPVTNIDTLNFALDEATKLAAKEFIHDLLASPSQARAGIHAGAG